MHHFTVGQRKGLGLSSPIRLYVVGIDAAAQTVTVGPREALERDALDATECELDCGEPPPHGHARHRANPTPPPGGRSHGLSGPDETAHAIFDEPQHAVAPGQAAVFYDGPVVLGGGWIRKKV